MRNIKDFSLQDQLQRCAVSVMNNIAEGFDSSSNKEFIRFLIYSQRSASEIMSMCYILEDVYQMQEISKLVYNRCLELRKQIKGFVKYLRKS